MATEFIYQPAASNRLGDYLKINLSSKKWTHFRAAVAFIKRTGTRHIALQVKEFAQTGKVEIIAGIDHRGTTADGLRDLLEAVKPSDRVIVFHNRLPFTFHPKVYLFKSSKAAEVLIGSGNLTEGGLFTNYEANLRLKLELSIPDQRAILQSIEHTIDEWADTSTGVAHILDLDLLNHLISLGLVPERETYVAEPEISPDAQLPIVEDRSIAVESETEPLNSLFISRPVPPAPPVPKVPPFELPVMPKPMNPSVFQTLTSDSPASRISHFIMTLQRTDVGVGQTTAGTSRRSPEIFIPLSARNAFPDFWNWPGGFKSDPRRPGKQDRLGVRMRLGTSVVSVNMMTWPAKHDFRLRSEALRSAGKVGDILHLEKVDPENGFEYFAQVIPMGTSQHASFKALCTQSVRNSQKMYGYY